jgi:hypothetical protein
MQDVDTPTEEEIETPAPVEPAEPEAAEPEAPDTPAEPEEITVAIGDETPAEEEIPLTLPLTALLAAALPVSATGEGTAPPVQAADAAHAAGMRGVAVRWGYLGLTPVDGWGAEAQITSPLQLLDLLEA